MSDPFEQLRAGADEDVATPDVDAIRSRARRIVRRRQFTLGAAATVIAAIAMIGIVVVPSQEPAQLAQREEQADTTAGSAATTAEDSAAVKSRSGDSAEQLQKAPSLAEPRAARARGDGASAPVAGAASEGSAVQLDATLTVQEGTVTQRGAEFTLKVCNPSSGSVTRNFSSGQRYDFEVRRGDDLVWRWSDGKAFAQAFGTETWKAKECKTWAERWNGMTSSGAPASSGRYDAVGVLTASEPQRTKPKSFCLDVC